MGRVGNKKSRRGCTRCKNRKVKCDEVRPACGWCKSHGIECEYPAQLNTNRTETTSASPTESAANSHRSASAAIANTTRMDYSRLEQGLFQYYMFTVARTFLFYDKERALELHADLIPQASLRFSGLQNAMYSYALLHMHVQSSAFGILPRNVDFFEEVGVQMRGSNWPGDDSGISPFCLHRDYLDRALQGQRGVVSEINEKNADGICITAVLLAQVALVHSSHMRLGNEYSVPSNWFRLQSSFSACLEAARPFLKMDSATSMMIHSAPSIDNRNLDRQAPGVFHWLLEWRPEGSTEQIDAQTKETYRNCIVYIENIQKRIAEQEPWQASGRCIQAFPNVAGPSFSALIEQYQPRALVILAHLLAMAKRIDGSWWVLQGVADYHVRGIASIIPGEWKRALEWPIRVLATDAADECFRLGRGPAAMDSPMAPS